jgi:phosphate transport system ATP-binding protein
MNERRLRFNVIQAEPSLLPPPGLAPELSVAQTVQSRHTIATAAELARAREKVRTRQLSVSFHSRRVLDNVSLILPDRCVSAIIGPSGCGKSTFLRCLNRMNDVIEGARVSGEVLLDGQDICAPQCDVVRLRKRVGMVFQKGTPFPKSIFENVAYGPRVAGIRGRSALGELVHQSLERAALWDEVRNRLDESALQLSAGQQQRLCIARTLATNPEVLLMDEPASGLDPSATARIEDLIVELKSDYTIVIVTHNMQQAARISDQTAFLCQGRLVEAGATNEVFTCPREQRTEDYITGRFG